MTDDANTQPPNNATDLPTDSPEPVGLESKWPQGLRLRSSAVIVGVFLAIETILVLRIAGMGIIENAAWDQLMIPLTGIETLASAAAGVLLGVSVQQSNVESANQRAEEAKLSEVETKKRLETAQTEAAAAADELDELGEATTRAAQADGSVLTRTNIDRAKRRLRNALKA